MASSRNVKLTTEQVIAALFESDDEHDSSSEGEISGNDGSEIDEDDSGLVIDQPEVNLRYVPDPCDRDSIFLDNNVSCHSFILCNYSQNTKLSL